MVMTKQDYATVQVDAALEDDCRQLIRLAVREDLERSLDWTTVCLVDQAKRGRCNVVPRQGGVCAGLVTAPWVVAEMDADLELITYIEDGEDLPVGRPILSVAGNARDLLTCERLILNLISRLCGVATLTAQYVAAIRGTDARLYDTRKTTPGWRRLEKYAVNRGGGHNHRTGLFDGFLIKDNHLALGTSGDDSRNEPLTPREAVERAKAWAGGAVELTNGVPEMVEVEVDSLDQLAEVLPAGPDIVLVDNFSLFDLRRAVAMRNAIAPAVELEASGNVTLRTIREIALTGVDRISSGALTHQAVWLDLGMDWSDDFLS
jgi:nicotinate-nucleotide pyrophosphorylase (carboxylating)